MGASSRVCATFKQVGRLSRSSLISPRKLGQRRSHVPTRDVAGLWSDCSHRIYTAPSWARAYEFS